MASHKFYVGEIVNLRPVVSRNAPGGAYEAAANRKNDRNGPGRRFRAKRRLNA